MVRRPKKQKNTVTYVRRPRQKRQGEIFDLLTGLVILLSLCMLVWFAYIYNIPTSKLNPFPPLPSPTLPPTIALPLPSQTAKVTSGPANGNATRPATPTSEFTATPADSTDVPFETITLPGPTSVAPTDINDSTETAVPKSYYSYAVIGVPPVSAIQASTLNPSRDCTWMGLGGNVFDIQSRPATGILVQVGGVLNKTRFLEPSLSGTALTYGPAGYEFTLANKPIASKHTLWVRLVDQSMQPLTPQIYFDTYGDCAHNLILVNFKQIK